MLNGLNPTLLIEIIVFIGGILLFFYGLLTDKKDKGKLRIKRCSATAEGHITGFDDRDKIVKVKKYKEYRTYNTYNHKKVETFYAPYVKFQDENGNVYEEKYPYPLQRRLSNGQKINVRYNPSNPYDFYIAGDKKVQVFSTQAMFAGIILIAASILLVINNFKP